MQELIEDLPLLPSQQYDIVIHIRLGDFNERPDFIEDCYYFQLFETLHFQKKPICLLCEPVKSESDALFLDKINHWFRVKDIPFNCETNSLLVDFNIMKQCKTLICSMSTLAWTAAYLSNHIQQCYMPNYNFFEVPLRRGTFFRKPIENTSLYPVKTTSPILSQITPYVITLPEYPARLEKLDDLRINLSLIGLETVIYYGVNGKNINIDNKTTLTYDNTTYTYDKTVRLNGVAMTRGEFGCAWSHLSLIKQLAEASEADQAYSLIFEDDVELVKPLDELYALLQHVPADADLCHLARSTWYPFVTTNQVNAYFYECEKKYFNNGTAYLVTKKGAQKIMDYVNHTINVPFDDMINMIYRLTPDFRLYVPSDYFFKQQENVLSTIKDIN
jgi:GR25 family glycosyltransferase involved in LPS biosynthesis